MDANTVKLLHTLNSEFYRLQSASFSSTRQAPWHGWQHLLLTLPPEFWSGEVLRVFDCACGNLRFEEFLTASFPQVAFEFYAADNCDDLAAASLLLQQTSEQNTSRTNVFYRHQDIASDLIAYQNACFDKPFTMPSAKQSSSACCKVLGCKDSGANAVLASSPSTSVLSPMFPACDISVCFGFFHHISTIELRIALLQALIQQTRVGGYVVVSLWRFLEDEQFARKAQLIHQSALRDFKASSSWSMGALTAQDMAAITFESLAPTDCFLGWQGKPGMYRYCHSFTEEDIAQLIAAVSNQAQLIARYTTDGKHNNLNTYLVFQRV